MRDVEQVLQSITTKCPGVNIRQLQVLHPGNDDDGLWFLDWPGSGFEVQIESSTGMAPFSVEPRENDARCITETVDETVRVVLKLLHLEP